MNATVQQHVHSAFNGTCIAPDCHNLWSLLQESQGSLENSQDYCYKWSRFVCGHHFTRLPGDAGPVTVADGVVQTVFDTIHSIIDPSYGSIVVKMSVPEEVLAIRPDESKDDAAEKDSKKDGRFKDKDEKNDHDDKNHTGSTNANSTTPISWNNQTNSGPWTTRPPFSNSTYNMTLSPKTATQTHLWSLAQDYYKGCMNDNDTEANYGVLLSLLEEVRGPFSWYDRMNLSSGGESQNRGKLRLNTTAPVSSEDTPVVVAAIMNLGRYGIFPVYKFGLGASYSDPTRVRLIMAPHYRTGLEDPNLYKLPGLLTQYERMLEIIIPKLHGAHTPEIQDLFNLPRNIIALEKKLHTILPTAEDWRNLTDHVFVIRADALRAYSWLLRFDEILRARPPQMDEAPDVDVLFPHSLHEFWTVFETASMETLRTYILWQTFLQTVDLWDMPWAKEWRAFTYTHLEVIKPVPRRDEYCVGRVQRHFSHAIGATLMNDVFPEKDGRDPVFRVGDILARVGHADGCPHNISQTSLTKIYKGAGVSGGKPGPNPLPQEPIGVARLTAHENWTHLHDWFELEKLHWQRQWADLGHSSDEHKCRDLGMSFKVVV